MCGWCVCVVCVCGLVAGGGYVCVEVCECGCVGGCMGVGVWVVYVVCGCGCVGEACHYNIRDCSPPTGHDSVSMWPLSGGRRLRLQSPCLPDSQS